MIRSGIIPVTNPTKVSAPAWNSPINHSAALPRAPKTPPASAVCPSSWSSAKNKFCMYPPPTFNYPFPRSRYLRLTHGDLDPGPLRPDAVYLLHGPPRREHGLLLVRPLAPLFPQLVQRHPQEDGGLLEPGEYG